MSDQRYPLQWPASKPRTQEGLRKNGNFATRKLGDRQYPQTQPLSLTQAVDRLQAEMERFGVDNAVLSTNVPLRLDGMPRGGLAQPADPGACLYFVLRGKAHALPCDRFTKVEQNIAAIAAHIEATRAIERYGVADVGELFQFAALPAPGQDAARGWRTVLGWTEGDRPTMAQVDATYRQLAANAHPDRGGSAERMAQINDAREAARRELGQ
ncbi:J domain-containing protein [Nevskia sp.]|uniref:J domain-containing protein n=1 Tax=Nevskia sp. TaxID=1929292 RepID=UPI003F6FAB15